MWKTTNPYYLTSSSNLNTTSWPHRGVLPRKWGLVGHKSGGRTQVRMRTTDTVQSLPFPKIMAGQAYRGKKMKYPFFNQPSCIDFDFDPKLVNMRVPPPHIWPLLARSGTMSQIVDWHVKLPRVRVCSCSQNIVIGALLSVRRPPPSLHCPLPNY